MSALKGYSLTHYEFEHPWVFLLLLLILCIYKCPLSLKRMIFPHIHLFSHKSNWFNREKLLYSLILTLLTVALASPISFQGQDNQQRKGRDLVFVLDTSGSMGESGYSAETVQESKFNILIELIDAFIKKRFDDNVGVVVFGSFAFSAVPITYDMQALSYMLDFLEVSMAGSSTAIGDGIMQALRALKTSKAKNKVIILITDGHQNSGQTPIKDAVHLAQKRGVKIYTIGIGKPYEYDKALLEKIAKDTHAKAFGAQNAKALQKVYHSLNQLEPSAIRSQHYLNKQMLFSYALAVATLLLLYLLSKRSL